MNISTIIVLSVIFIAVAFAIRNIIKNGDTCSCGCKCCGKCENCKNKIKLDSKVVTTNM